VQQAQLDRLTSAATVLHERVENSLMFGRYDIDDVMGRDVPGDIQLRASVGGTVVMSSRQFPGDLPLAVSPGVYRLGDRYVLAQRLGPRQRVRAPHAGPLRSGHRRSPTAHREAETAKAHRG